MDFQPSDRARQTAQRVRQFIQTHIEPVEKEHWEGILAQRHGGDWTQWKIPPRVEALKAKAKAEAEARSPVPTGITPSYSTPQYPPLSQQTQPSATDFLQQPRAPPAAQPAPRHGANEG